MIRSYDKGKINNYKQKIASEYMKGEITMKILEKIGDIASGSVDIIDVFLTAGYGASYGRMNYMLNQRDVEKAKVAIEKEVRRKLTIRYRKMLYKLKADGLIKESSKSNKLLLTKLGKIKLLRLKKQLKEPLPPKKIFQKEIGDDWVVVIFDIPEKMRRKRDWLRDVVKNLGMKMIQKSVWIGKIKIPKIFLDDLLKMQITPYVEIFELRKSGTLEQITQSQTSE